MGVHGGPYDSSILLSENVASASGATNTTTVFTDSSGDVWRVYTFLESGNFTTDVASKCDVLVVAGGGGGGFNVGGGGGAGGLVYSGSVSVDPGTYTVVVGAGGIGRYSGQDPAQCTSGNNSSIDITGVVTAIGGGRGGGYITSWSDGPSSGGSGGAGRHGQAPAGGTTGQGNSGGYGSSMAGQTDSWNYGGGGGGGAAAVGGGATPTNYAGNGGPGLDYSDTFGTVGGASGTFAGGGGGSRQGGTAVGTGSFGGGDGSVFGSADGDAGGTNTGGGGGAEKNGGSGIVVVRLGAV